MSSDTGETFEQSQALDAEIAAGLPPLATSTPPKGTLWHYTNREGFVGILKSRTIWATNFRFLNDAQELLLGEEEIYSAVKQLCAPGGRHREELALWQRVHSYRSWAEPSTRLLSVHVASFSEDPDDLAQWRAYGSGQEGCGLSLGIKFPDVEAWSVAAGAMLVQCEYDTGKFEQLVGDRLSAIDSLHRELREGGRFGRDAMRYRFLSQIHQDAALLAVRRKHQGFSGEKEWRIVTIESEPARISRRALGASSIPIPYVPVPLPLLEKRVLLEGVRVGPSTYLAQRVTDARILLAEQGYDLLDYEGVRVQGSEIPFRPVRPQ